MKKPPLYRNCQFSLDVPPVDTEEKYFMCGLDFPHEVVYMVGASAF